MAGTTKSTIGGRGHREPEPAVRAGRSPAARRRFGRFWLPVAILVAALGWQGTALAEKAPGAPAAPPFTALPPPPPPVAAPAPVPAPAAGDDAFDLRVRALEERVSEVKEQVFRAKARLQLLGQKAAGADAAGAKAVIVHRNEMGAAFSLESISYRLDGATIFDRVDAGGDLAKQEEFEVWSGRVMPGRHTLSVMATFRGSGFGLFPYLEGYKFRATGTYELTCDGGKVTTVKVVSYEQGGITTKLEERPAVRFDVAQAPDTSLAGGDARR